MKKLVLGIIAVIITVAVVALYQFHKDEAIATAETPDVYQSDRPVYDQLVQELDSTEIYNDSIIYGYWFKPHEACYFNLFLHIDNTFVFKYYVVPNDSTIVDVVKRGSFVVDGEMIKLTADDGWDENVFNGIVYRKHNGTNFYLTDDEDGMYLVKGSD
jgi:hypothetical protein